METARRASVSAWNGFVDCNSLSFPLLLYNTHSAANPPNSLLLDGTLFPGGLSGKWLPVVVQVVTQGGTDAGWFHPPQYDWYVPRRSRSRGIDLTPPRSQVDALVV